VAVHQQFALGRELIAIEQAEQRGFPGSARPHQADELPSAYLQGDISEGRDLDGPDLVDFPHVMELNHQ